MELFGLRKKDNSIRTPIAGDLIDITEVNDTTFSSKLMGDGFAVKPCENIVCAPCSGKLVMLFNTSHAFGILCENGVEVLVHIGIDAANKNGEGFKPLVQVNSKVKKGMPIIAFDDEVLKDYDMTTMVIITNSNNHTINIRVENRRVNKGESIIEID